MVRDKCLIIWILMDDIGCRWTVWEDNGNRPGLAGNVVARPEGRYPRRNNRASALSGSARSLIETSQTDSQPVDGRPENHSRLRESIDKVSNRQPPCRFIASGQSAAGAAPSERKTLIASGLAGDALRPSVLDPGWLGCEQTHQYLAWTCTSAVLTQSRDLVLGR